MEIRTFFKKANYGNFNWYIKDKLFSWVQRRKLRDKEFTIIGNNCLAGSMYHKFGLPYSSPTIWTTMYPDDYLKFLENLDWYLKQPLTFTETSKHEDKGSKLRVFPIGVLGGDVEIFFVHYKTKEQALAAWNRRVKRINYTKLFVVFSDDGDKNFSEEYFEKFDKLPFDNKLFFTGKQREGCNYATKYIYDDVRSRRYEKNLDSVKWLNGESNFLKKHKI